MLDNMSPNERLVFGLIALIVLAGSIQVLQALGPFLLLIFIVGMIIYSSRNDRNHNHRGTYYGGYGDASERDAAVVERPRSANQDVVHAHALTAVREAGLDPDQMTVLPVDIGIMSFHGDDDPVLHRTWPIADDCDYIQPFVQLRVPQVATGRVKFELVDRYYQPVFVHEDHYHLERGRNLIIPAARLPVHDEQEMDGTWTLNIYAGNTKLASYTFEWDASDDPEHERRVGEDGEINSEMRALLSESRLRRMTLDDLLSDQGEASQQEN